MSKNMSSQGRRYDDAAAKFDSAVNKYDTQVDAATKDYQKDYNKYAGEAGLNSATNYAKNDQGMNIASDYAKNDQGLNIATQYAENQAGQQSQRAGNQAAANATRGASTAGLNKAQAAMMSRQAAADTTGNTYQNVYDSSRNTALNNYQVARSEALNNYQNARNSALNNNQATLAAKQGEYSTRVGAAAVPVNAQGQKMSAAQQEDQNAYNRSWGNLGGIGSMVTGLLTSDERLKNFREVSSKLDTNKPEDNNKDDYMLLKVSYRKENK